jgi:flagellar protein FlaJ
MTKTNEKFSFIGFAYSHFGGFGKIILSLFKNLPNDLAKAGKKIYPEAYASFIGFSFFISLIICIPISILLTFFYGTYFLTMIFIPPLVLIFLLYIYPKLAISNRTSALEAEVPYAAAYISVMATGGISPYKSLERLKDCNLLPNLSIAAKEVDVNVKAFGTDPVSAIEESANNVPAKEYKELLLGYASTLRVGGDVTHYLLRRTQLMFEQRVEKVKLIAERISVLLEAYISVSCLLGLSLITIFIISKAFPILETGFATESTFILFSWVMLPLISILFIYLGDILQPRYPVTDWRPYKVFLFTLPITAILSLAFVFPFYFDVLKIIFGGFMPILNYIREIMNIDEGFLLPIGLSITIIITCIPPMIANYIYSRETSGIIEGLVNFLRDLVEARKTGLSPEKCIENLSDRDYGEFSKHLKIIANKIAWGTPLKKIYETFIKRVHSWLAMINIYLLIDAIDVGGGSPETLESLASFGENILFLEKQKRSNLRPLMLVPYIGAIVLVLTTIVQIGFVRQLLLMANRYFAYGEFVKLFVTPIVLNSALTGFVAGKIAEEKVSAGFKHAFILVLITLIFMSLSSSIIVSLTPVSP